MVGNTLYLAGLGLLTWLLTRRWTTGPVPRRARREALLAVTAVICGIVVVSVLLVLVTANQESPGTPQTNAEPGDGPTVGQGQLLSVVILGLLYAAPAIAVMRWRRIPAAAVGLTRRGLVRALLVALAIGAVSSITMLLAGDREPMAVLAGLGCGHLLLFIYFLAVGASEEFLFRGYLQQHLEGWLGTPVGWATASVLMALSHLAQRVAVRGMATGEAWLDCLQLIPVSLFMGWIMIRTRNLAAPIVAHAFADWVSVLA